MTQLWHRLLPRSITTQLTMIVTVSVVVGVVFFVGLYIFFDRDSRQKPPVLVARIATVSLMVQNAQSPVEVDTIVSSARKSGMQVSLVKLAELTALAGPGTLPVTSSLVAEQLRVAWNLDVLEDVRLPNADTEQLAIGVGEYGALLFEVSSGLRDFLLPPTLLALAIVVVFVTLISVYAVRWIISPLRALADGAQSFGRSPESDFLLSRRGPKEITRVADALDDMRNRIRTLLDDRTRMLTAISHDLNTPLTRLGLRAERIADEGLRKGIQHEVEQVTHMLDETLGYLRQDVRSEDISRIDLPSVLQTICAEFADVGHDVSYEGPMRLPLSCKTSVLTRAISNIVDNAVKHGTQVTVTLRSTTFDLVEIDIADNGPGIPASKRDLVFDPFMKIDEARDPEKRNGFGLGLSIARDVIRGHGGEIYLLDGEPNGLVVRMLLPIDG